MYEPSQKGTRPSDPPLAFVKVNGVLTGGGRARWSRAVDAPGKAEIRIGKINASRPVSRVLYGAPPGRRARWPFLWGDCRQPPRATNPDDDPEKGPEAFPPPVVPIRFCSRRGLPCRFRCRTRGALLPHPFTLTPGRSQRRFAFCGAFPGVAPAGRYPAPFLRGARTFLCPSREQRPSGRLAWAV